jgi:signal peptidase II
MHPRSMPRIIFRSRTRMTPTTDKLPTANFRDTAALTRLAVPALIGFALDLWTKHLAVVHLKATLATVRFIPGWLHWEYTENRGAVFGSGQGLRWLFVSVSVLAIGFLLYLFSTSDRRQRGYQVLLGILLAGVLGNLYDRLFLGYVRDMIHALPSIHWSALFGASDDPASWVNQPVFPWIFNVADTLLCVGVFLMIVYSLLYGPTSARTGGSQDAKLDRAEPAQD